MTESDDLTRNFTDLALEHLRGLDSDILALERAAPEDRRERAEGVMRGLQAVRSSAAVLEMENIPSLALALEQAVDALAEGRMAPVPETMNTLLDALDMLQTLVEDAGEGRTRDPAETLEALRTLPVHGRAESRTETAPGGPGPSTAPAPAKAAPAAPPARKQAAAPPARRAEAPVPATRPAPGVPAAQPIPRPGAPLGVPGRTPSIRLDGDHNPLGLPEEARLAALARGPGIYQYPQNGTPSLTAALAEHLGQPQDRILTGNGLNELIDLLIRVKARPGLDHVLTCQGCPPRYQAIADLCRVELRTVPREPDFSLPLDTLVAEAGERTAAILLANPDDPTGHAATAEELTVMTALVPAHTLVIIDETLIDFAWPEEEYSILPLLDRFPNLVVVRSFCRGHGLAGLRLGYAIMHQDLAGVIRRARIPFSVNSLAESAGLALLANPDHAMAALDMAIRERDRLARGLDALGCAFVPGQGNFVFFIPPVAAAEVARGLAQRDVAVRTLDSAGFPQALRVSVGLPEHNAAFLKALEAVLRA